eukprot:5587961-Prymnesium_polylepis.1
MDKPGIIRAEPAILLVGAAGNAHVIRLERLPDTRRASETCLARRGHEYLLVSSRASIERLHQLSDETLAEAPRIERHLRLRRWPRQAACNVKLHAGAVELVALPPLVGRVEGGVALPLVLRELGCSSGLHQTLQEVGSLGREQVDLAILRVVLPEVPGPGSRQIHVVLNVPDVAESVALPGAPEKPQRADPEADVQATGCVASPMQRERVAKLALHVLARVLGARGRRGHVQAAVERLLHPIALVEQH